MTRKQRREPTPAVAYPPGWFTEPARAWGVIAPSMDAVPAEVLKQRQRDINTQRSRDVALATGAGWATGSLVLDGTPKHPRPMWLARAPARREKAG